MDERVSGEEPFCETPEQAIAHAAEVMEGSSLLLRGMGACADVPRAMQAELSVVACALDACVRTFDELPEEVR